MKNKGNNNLSEIILLKDKEWSTVDSEACRVISFTPLRLDKTTPYASIELECKKFPKNITGYITHKIDFANLCAAFKERGVKQNEEVIIFWSKKHLKTFPKAISAFMPKLWVMICPKGAYELMTDQNFKPELKGEARWNAQRPIAEWKPEVMK